MLDIKNVSKSFGSITALEDINLQVDAGEFVFLTGPSGAGKTTLLRLILREMLPDTGEIDLGGIDVTKLKHKEIPLLRQQIGVVFQDFKILPERTLRENVEVALAVIGLPHKEWNARVDRVLELSGLIKRANLFPSQLSGGELQRVSLARALVVNPKIILADEPTGNLDWETADKMMELFEKINEEGKTIVMATHHKLIVDKMKKRTININEGRLTGESNPNKKAKEESKGRDKLSDKEEKKKKERKKEKG